MRRSILALAAALAACGGTEVGFDLVSIFGSSAAPEFDLVVLGGRVIDPETGLDAIRNVGVKDGRIAEISEREMTGADQLDARGLVVAPGFIDLHQHGQSPENYRAQIRDGITTALELEIGVENIAEWYDERLGKSPVNFGASVSHVYARQAVVLGRSQGLSGDGMGEPLTPEQIDGVAARIREGLDEGAAAVGFGIAYTPGVNDQELEAMFATAAEADASCHVHMRRGYDLANLEEVRRAAEATGASAHIVHLNSSARDEAPQYVERILEIQASGLDLTTEYYPYNRGSTQIEAAFFADWESYSDEEIAQYIWVETGETLTRETFGKYRARGGTIISPPAYSEESVRFLVEHPVTMIASDGMWLVEGRAHPRSFGTFSRVLGRYVRENGTPSLAAALEKMTLRPARRLEKRVPEMRRKGRVQEGADADLVVFDPETILDRGTYSDPAQSPVGVRHVLVNGTVSLREGELVEGAVGGRPIRASRPAIAKASSR